MQAQKEFGAGQLYGIVSLQSSSCNFTKIWCRTTLRYRKFTMSETLQFAFVQAQKEFGAGQLYGIVSFQSVRRQKFL